MLVRSFGDESDNMIESRIVSVGWKLICFCIHCFCIHIQAVDMTSQPLFQVFLADKNVHVRFVTSDNIPVHLPGKIFDSFFRKTNFFFLGSQPVPLFVWTHVVVTFSSPEVFFWCLCVFFAWHRCCRFHCTSTASLLWPCPALISNRLLHLPVCLVWATLVTWARHAIKRTTSTEVRTSVVLVGLTCCIAVAIDDLRVFDTPMTAADVENFYSAFPTLKSAAYLTVTYVAATIPPPTTTKTTTTTIESSRPVTGVLTPPPAPATTKTSSKASTFTASSPAESSSFSSSSTTSSTTLNIHQSTTNNAVQQTSESPVDALVFILLGCGLFVLLVVIIIVVVVVVLKKRRTNSADEHSGSEMSASQPSGQSEYGPLVLGAPSSNYSGFESKQQAL